jgi:hypothetical protein
VVNTTCSVHSNNPAVSSALMWRVLHLIMAAAILSGYALVCVYLGNTLATLIATLIWGV